MLAIIGGSGLTQLANLDVSHREVVRTPYGEPSGAVTFGEICGRPVAFLARHAGKVVTHRQILTAVWGPAHAEDTQYLRVYVGQLRQKIEAAPDDPRIIITEPGIGYRIADD